MIFGSPKSLPKGHSFWKKRVKPSYQQESFLLFFLKDTFSTKEEMSKNIQKKKAIPLFSFGFIVGRKVHKAHGRNKIKRRLRCIMTGLYKEIRCGNFQNIEYFLQHKTCGFIFLIKNKNILDIPYDVLSRDLIKQCLDILQRHLSPEKPSKSLNIPMDCFRKNVADENLSTYSTELLKENPGIYPPIHEQCVKSSSCGQYIEVKKTLCLDSPGKKPNKDQQGKRKNTIKNPLTYGVTLFLWGIYRCIVAPFLSGQCCFSPTCSVYALEIMAQKPFFSALYMVIKRLIKCHPWSKKPQV